jgi:hypothetical protein
VLEVTLRGCDVRPLSPLSPSHRHAPAPSWFLGAFNAPRLTAFLEYGGRRTSATATHPVSLRCSPPPSRPPPSPLSTENADTKKFGGVRHHVLCGTDHLGHGKCLPMGVRPRYYRRCSHGTCPALYTPLHAIAQCACPAPRVVVHPLHISSRPLEFTHPRPLAEPTTLNLIRRTAVAIPAPQRSGQPSSWTSKGRFWRTESGASGAQSSSVASPSKVWRWPWHP